MQLHPMFGSEWLLFMDEHGTFIHKKEPLRTKYWMQLGYNQLLVPAQKIFLTVYVWKSLSRVVQDILLNLLFSVFTWDIKMCFFALISWESQRS